MEWGEDRLVSWTSWASTNLNNYTGSAALRDVKLFDTWSRGNW